MNDFFRLGCVIAASFFSAAALPAAAQAWPDRPVRLVVGFPPGGAADILGRLAAQRLTETLRQQVVVDNRGGAGGLIATEIAAKADPDGYTLLFTSIPHVINPHLYRKASYDAIRDFSPVVLFVTVPLMLAVTPALPAKSVKELIAYAKSRPGQLNYASAGNGSSSHLAMELFRTMAGISLNHIPYKGTGPLLTDLIAGQVSLTIASAVPLIPQVKAGKLRGLAITSARRSAAVPDLPTIGETVPGYDVTNWFGILAPAGTPKAIVSRVNQELDKALQQRETVEMLNARGADAGGGTPEAFAKLIRA
ncbi:MAG TPA: tripartite tricarboxylate transporter substrate binding protein, partial [Opitutaceae bacterium]|nr:tripartite tricarboxylate transporter substrate binding protein [Opitutaceae bacterium]